MAQLELGQSKPAVIFDGDEAATVFLVVHDARSPEWRADFNARARSEHVPVEAWWIDGRTVLQVAVACRQNSHPGHVLQTINSAVRLLEGRDQVAAPVRVENLNPDRDPRGIIESTVNTWWASYRRAA